MSTVLKKTDFLMIGIVVIAAVVGVYFTMQYFNKPKVDQPAK